MQRIRRSAISRTLTIHASVWNFNSFMVLHSVQVNNKLNQRLIVIENNSRALGLGLFESTFTS